VCSSDLALPVEAMVHDLDILKDLGCNFVRTCHYPNDMRFLDLCDEMGFYLWEESHARNVSFSHPQFTRQIHAVTQEMIAWHANRPSILIWGCLNECESDSAEGRGVYESVIALIRRLDPTRPVTFAGNRGRGDLCLGLIDIVSWNRYDAWHQGDPSLIASTIKQELRWLHSDESGGGKGKPVILSEFGAAALYGYRGANRTKWSEEYQAAVLDECLNVYLNHPDIVGTAIWQFADARVTEEFWPTRPRMMNNKGTLDEYRRRKLAYEVVKARHLASQRKHLRKTV
jgi:beta-glucuronidase